MDRLSIDIETYSDIDIGESGAYAYAESPNFEILLIAYRINDESVRLIDLTCEDAETHPRFMTMLKDKNVLKTAFNANFERTCLGRYYGYMPPEEWHCTMVLAAEHGLPMSLAAVGEAIGLPEEQQKLKTGKALIQYFCKPCKPTKANGGRTRNLPEHDPEKWKLFKEYCIQDVYTENAILERLEHYGALPDSEWVLWSLDQRMNDYGIKIDIPYIEKIIEHDVAATERLKQEAIEITGLSNPNSITQLLAWLKDRGVNATSLTKGAVAELLATDLPDDVRRVLNIRQALGKTSVKKFEAMSNAVSHGDRLRGILQFYGANRTGRWAGRIVQVHNLPQNHIEDLEDCREMVAAGDFDMVEMIWGETAFIFSELVRTAFIASEGCRFVVSDFSAIEARVIAWLANETWRMDVFANGGDIYCASASQMFKVPVVKHGINGHLRQKGKVAELACGYQGGVGAMLRMDTSHAIPEEELPKIVADWRKASPNIVKLWAQAEGAVKVVIADARPKSRAAKIGRDGCVKVYMNDNILCIELPSGRRLAYYDACLKDMNGDGRLHICYRGIEQATKRWGWQETYGGKIVENCVQAIARDCLAEAMQRVTNDGYQIVMHVHDEMIVDVPLEDTNALEKINALMGITPEWAGGLILRGDGYETPFYKKD